ncbi:MAG: response regulator transcription factor [Thiothrix litoralis]|uniref:response regulator transcription factor n=1 Tax=Thiothrix litoralis TaxID=2891210 RepID=UPI003C73BB13
MDIFEGKSIKRLLIVEDNEVLCHFLQKSLQHDGYEVEALLTGELIPKVMERNCIHLVVLDIVLPGKDGMYWLKWMKQYYPIIPVVIMSAKVQPDDRLLGLEAGASDYLTKPFHDRELLIKVNRLLKRANDETHEHVLHMGNITVNTVDNRVQKGNKVVTLTKLECKILQLFYMNVGIPLSRDELMQQTMGIVYSPPNRSIDTHINRLRNKIEDAPSNPVHIRTVRGKGYCFYIKQ